METLVAALMFDLTIRATRLRGAMQERRLGSDDGVSTLEMVIIALGLMGVAAVLVAAITTAVNTRTKGIK